MKTIKVFLASSEELKSERLEFSDLVLQLNDLFEKRDVQLKLVKWEHLDASMGVKHKQEEYNDKLKECELCLTLYWTKFGDYTAEELETAYAELKEGRNPRKLYVFFKDAEEITPELQQFKDSFATNYGHFFCKFENVDTMRLQFLLQLEAYQNSTSEKLLKVENQKVLVEGEPIVDLNNVPFAAMNKDFCSLRDGLEACNNEIIQFEAILAQMQNPAIEAMLNAKKAERIKLQEELDKYQEFLFDMARKTSLLSSQRISNRSAEAIRLFNEGDAVGANAVLNTEDLERDSQRNFDDYDHHTALAEEARERIEQLLNDWQLKIDTSLTDTKIPIEERIEAAFNAHEQVIAHAKKLKYHECDKEKYASLVFDYARFSNKYARYDKACELYLEHIQFCEELYGKDSEELAVDYNNIGTVCIDQGRQQDALVYVFKAVDIYKKLGDDGEIIAHFYSNIGYIYNRLEDYPMAFEYHHKALYIREKLLGAENEDTATSYDNIGAVYYSKGNYTKALEYFFKAYNILKKLLGDECLEIAISCDNIGAAYKELQEYDKALEYLFKALKIHKEVLGKDHPDTKEIAARIKNITNNIGIDLYDNGEYQEATSLYLKAVEMDEEFLGMDHVDMATEYSNLGNAYYMSGNVDNALQYYVKCANIRDANLGIHEDTATAFACIGYFSSDQSQALEYHLKAAQYRQELLGEEHLDTAQSYFDVGNTYIDLKDYANALEFLHKSLEIRTKLLGEQSDEVAITCNDIGYTCNEAGEYQKAMEYHHRALNIRLALFGEDDVQTANSYNHIGKTYNYLGQYAAAIEWLNKALPIRERELGREHQNTIATREQLEEAKSKLNQMPEKMPEPEQIPVPESEPSPEEPAQPSFFAKVKKIFKL